MASLAALLMSLVGPMVLRALLVLGIGTVTFVGVDTALSGLVSMAVSSWSSIPAAALSLLSLAGVPEGLGIIAGSMLGRVSLWAAASAVRWVKS